MTIHIKVDKTKEKQAARRLSKIYGISATEFPLGIRMRLVSEFGEVKGNPVMMGKICVCDYARHNLIIIQ